MFLEPPFNKPIPSAYYYMETHLNIIVTAAHVEITPGPRLDGVICIGLTAPLGGSFELGGLPDHIQSENMDITPKTTVCLTL